MKKIILLALIAFGIKAKDWPVLIFLETGKSFYIHIKKDANAPAHSLLAETYKNIPRARGISTLNINCKELTQEELAKPLKTFFVTTKIYEKGKEVRTEFAKPNISIIIGNRIK